MLVLVTDGQETTSHATLKSAIQAARKAHVAVYPVGIESISFSPAPLERLASSTGGTYHGARSSAALTSIYATISNELRRTWQIQYVTAARPGDRINVKVTAPGYGSAKGAATLAGRGVRTLRLVEHGPTHRVRPGRARRQWGSSSGQSSTRSPHEPSASTPSSERSRAMRLAGIEPATLRSGGARSIP